MATDQGTIAPDGDIILIIGDDRARRLRVLSIMLSAASSVFKALFGPHFREGSQPRSSASPFEIALPDDDYAAMKWLCSLLHHKPTADFDSAPCTQHVLDFAQLVDKYDCAGALRLQSRALLLRYVAHALEGKDLIDHLCAATTAAYLLREPFSFKSLTQKLIANTSGSFLAAREVESVRAALPQSVLAALEAKRSAARSKLIQSLAGLSRCSQCGPAGSNDYEGFLSVVTKRLQQQFWPPDLSLSTALPLQEIAIQIRCIQDYKLSCCVKNKWNDLWATWVRNDELVSLAVIISNMTEGLCLKCVEEDQPDLTKKCEKHT